MPSTHRRRLGAIGRQLAPTACAVEAEATIGPTPGSDDAWAAENHPRIVLGTAQLGLSDDQLNEWVSRGMVVLPEAQMGLPHGWHQRVPTQSPPQLGCRGDL